MNGATTDPLVRITNPPKIIIRKRTGMSQYFFVEKTNPKMSLRKSIRNLR
jgi:hypothetical protein